MRILQVHKYLYRRAGAEAYFLDAASLLAKHGHKVGMWGTSENAEYRMQNVEYFKDLLVEPLNFDRREGFMRDLKKFGHMIWSTEAAQKFDRVMREFKPEIAHIHNIYHHLSPSILPVAARHSVPVVMTVHDWKIINPNYSLFDHGYLCERDGLRAILHRCIKNSYSATAADVIEMTVHRMLRVYEKHVARFLVPGEFVKKKLVACGMDEKRIEVVPLPVHNPTQPPLTLRGGDSESFPFKVRGDRGVMSDYILFAGRLTVEKGIYTVLEIAKRLPEIKFKIAGTGPEFRNVELGIMNYELRNVELLGFQEKAKLQHLIAGSRLVIVPSLWYELSPLSVLEGMVLGKVVVASRIGGISDLIEDGKTGVLVDVRSGQAVSVRDLDAKWVDLIKKVYYDEALQARVGKAAQKYASAVHSPEKHYEKLMKVYQDVL